MQDLPALQTHLPYPSYPFQQILISANHKNSPNDRESSFLLSSEFKCLKDTLSSKVTSSHNMLLYQIQEFSSRINVIYLKQTHIPQGENKQHV
jgi:hypothetical protein